MGDEMVEEVVGDEMVEEEMVEEMEKVEVLHWRRMIYGVPTYPEEVAV